jgi:ribosomal protein S24E
MEFKITSQKKNPLFLREELEIEVVSDNNPQKKEILEFLKKNPELCVIKEIQGNFGRDVFSVLVFIYDNIEAKERTEYIPRKIRKKLEEEKKKAEEEAKIKAEAEKKKAEEEKAAEAAKVETKTEEVKTE